MTAPRTGGAHELFTVKHDGRTIIPAFQLDADGEPRPELQPVLQLAVEIAKKLAHLLGGEFVVGQGSNSLDVA